MRTVSQSINVFAVLVCAALFGAGWTEAANIDWEGGGEGNRDGVFGVADNWNPAQVPGTNDFAQFLIDEAYAVSFDAPATNQTVNIYYGLVTFDLGGHTWVMEKEDNKARFDVQGDEASQPVAILTNGYFWCKNEFRPASSANKYGTVILRGADATFRCSAALLGSGGEGTLRMEQGATGIVTTVRLGWLGGNGYLDVLDPGSHIYATGNMDANYTGSGGITLSNEGAASFYDFNLGRGSILLDGGTLEIRRDMSLGWAGVVEGDLSVIMRNGALLTATRYGRFGLSGSSNVTGRIESGSRWIGNIAQIGSHPGSAEVTVTGAGSLMESSGGLSVANSNGYGLLTVADGGQVAIGGSYSMRIAAADTNAVGEVIVAGSNSTIIGSNRIELAGNQYAPGNPSHVKGGQALLALRAGGRLAVADDPEQFLDLRVHETGTVELDGGFMDISQIVFYAPDGVIATNAGTLRVILNPEQANAAAAMAVTIDNNELNGARLELGLAPDCKPQLGDAFKVIAGAATEPVGAFTWQGAEIADGDILMLDKYGFRADISGNDFTLTTAVVPPGGTIFNIR